MANVAVIGTGYVGLTTGAILAHLGHHVVCADVVPEKVKSLSRGEVPILEDGLDELVREGLDGGRLSFVLGAAVAVEESDAEFIFLCVPTPQGDDGSADLSYIEEAAREIGPVVRPESVIINKSTVPVGSTLVVERALGRGNVAVVSNPEFLREGSAVYDALNPDRIVIGSEDQAAAIRVASLYTDVKAPVIVTDPASAETIKYASNAFLATKISFVNAVANLCEAVGADVRDVIVGMGYDRRIGFEFLKPGPGWGGSCFVGDETLLRRRGDDITLMTLRELDDEVQRRGLQDLEVLSHDVGQPRPEFLPVRVFTKRPYDGCLVTVETKMGRRVTVTEDHPILVCDGIDERTAVRKLASDVSTSDWLPIAQNAPVTDVARPWADIRSVGQIAERDNVVKPEPVESVLLSRRRGRSTTVTRLADLTAYRVPLLRGRLASARSRFDLPPRIELDEHFWRVVGLYISEGCTWKERGTELIWSFSHDEQHLADTVTEYWTSIRVHSRVARTPTTIEVRVPSRLLREWWVTEIGLGSDAYAQRIPDRIWSSSDAAKRSLLRGIWDGDGNWSLVNGGPSLVYEFGTASRELADGVVRLLGDLGVVARLKVARTAKSTVDTYWVQISGKRQLEACDFLFPEDEVHLHLEHLSQIKYIAPTGYRRLSKGTAWVRVVRTTQRSFTGEVFSLEVVPTHTVVTSYGLITSQCFPKDSRALVRIAEDNGYDFSLLKGVIEVNDEQFERMASKIEKMIDGPLDGATVGVWGLTFKARTDDTRRSPSIEIIERLQKKGVKLRAYDPAASDTPHGVERVADAYAAGEGADVIAVLTEWDEFRWIDFEKLAGVMRTPKIVDCRNLLDAAAVRRKGFTFEGLGRP